MKTTFSEIISEVLKAEGGYVDDPDDKGGATNYGVTQATFSAFIGRDASKDEIKDMQEGDAIECYEEMFWKKSKLDQFVDGLKHIYFDMVVNMGGRNAGKIIQRSINTKRNNNALDVDGIVGSGTLAQVDSIVIDDVLVERGMFFANNCFDGSRYDLRTSQNKFLRGWFFHRVFHFLTYPLKAIIQQKDEKIEELENRIQELEEAA